MIDRLYRARPRWLGRAAGWLVWETSFPLPGWLLARLVGVQLGRRGRRVR